MSTLISKGVYCQSDQYDHLIFNERYEEKYLYHYTTLNSLIAITESKALRASSFENCNDPTESQINNRTEIDVAMPSDLEGRKTWMATKNLGNRVLDGIRRKAHVVCLSSDRIERCKIVRKGFAIPQMWAHYADNHKGVCLIFDKSALMSEASKIKNGMVAKDVTYDTSQASGSTIRIHVSEVQKIEEHELRAKCLDISPELFWFYKDSGWSYEQEHRIVFSSPTAEYTYIPIMNSVKAICTGVNFPQCRLHQINKFKNAFGLQRELSPKIFWDKGVGIAQGVPLRTPS